MCELMQETLSTINREYIGGNNQQQQEHERRKRSTCAALFHNIKRDCTEILKIQ